MKRSGWVLILLVLLGAGGVGFLMTALDDGGRAGRVGTQLSGSSDGQADDEFETGQIAQVNLLHYPMSGVMIGGELIWGEREDVDGEDADDLRVQMSLKVNFPR